MLRNGRISLEKGQTLLEKGQTSSFKDRFVWGKDIKGRIFQIKGQTGNFKRQYNKLNPKQCQSGSRLLKKLSQHMQQLHKHSNTEREKNFSDQSQSSTKE